MKIYRYPDIKDWNEIVKRPVFETASVEKSVKKILEKVHRNGDRSVKTFTKLFDDVSIRKLLVDDKEIREAVKLVPDELKSAIDIAKTNIEKFHLLQKEDVKYIETATGVLCWRKSIAIEKVGLYIPGGSAPLFSTILMLGIPAKLAGCEEIVLCTPPNKEKKINPAILYTANLVGITKIFKCGGVQAIGAMAYGTESIPKVYKIFGPGNQYVTYAKQMIQKEGIAIDMPAGPSEVAVFADVSADPAFVTADLLSQAEHGADSQVLLVTNDEALINKVQEAIRVQLEKLPRKDIAEKSLENSRIVLARSEQEAIDLLNYYAPEHLILNCDNAESFAEKVINAGSVFIGAYSPESAGDYASGTNHTLPTNGFAKAYSGVSMDSFVRKITFQKLTKEGLKQIGNAVVKMAEAEGLNAHAEAVRVRLEDTKNRQ